MKKAYLLNDIQGGHGWDIYIGKFIWRTPNSYIYGLFSSDYVDESMQLTDDEFHQALKQFKKFKEEDFTAYDQD